MIIKNIRIVDDTQDFTGDILVKEGIIIAVGENLADQNQEEIQYDYSGQNVVLLPAFTDLHVHFRDPGFTYKEDVISGSKAAIRGGFTAVNLMPNTNPVCSSLDIAKDVEKRVQEAGFITANQTMSMTKDLQGKEYEHLKSLKKGEILFVTDDGKGVNDAAVMKEIFKICKEKEIVIMAHEEDSRYSATDMRKAENEMTFRDLELCRKLDGKIHFCHVSTIEAIEAIAEYKRKGLQITCEVTPHHITATGAETNHYRVNPPLREQKDIDALIKAIQSGVVDAIATDHAPHTAEDKANGAPGMTGLEIAFPLCYTALVKTGKITLSQLVKLMSATPSSMMRLNKGRIGEGRDADFVIIELETPYIINSAQFVSKGKNTPFHGKQVFGKVLKTCRKGIFHN
jgi:dihydroorotase